MPTDIETLIQRYRSGEVSLDQLADILAGYPYKRPGLHDMSYDDALEQIGAPPEEGTWQEIDAARAEGVLTADEYDVILKRHWDRPRG